MSARPDRLAAITAWIAGLGILAVCLLALDTVSLKRPPAAAAELPRGCPTPGAGEQLQITVVLRDGLLDVTCRTVHAALPMKRSPR